MSMDGTGVRTFAKVDGLEAMVATEDVVFTFGRTGPQARRLLMVRLPRGVPFPRFRPGAGRY